MKRYRGLRERIAVLLARRAAELGIEPAVPPAQVATMTFAMANGIALERLLEPEAVPDDLAPTMMATFFTGLRARPASRGAAGKPRRAHGLRQRTPAPTARSR